MSTRVKYPTSVPAMAVTRCSLENRNNKIILLCIELGCVVLCFLVIIIMVLMQGSYFRGVQIFCTALYCLWAESKKKTDVRA